jgi:hypothetical protein
MAAGIPAIEMAIRTIFDIGMMIEHRNDDDKTIYERHAYNLTADLGGAFFYGLLAANVIPMSAVIGGLGFVGYSFVKYFFYPKQECYWTTRAIFEWPKWAVYSIPKWIIQNIFVPTCKKAWIYLAKPVWDYALQPLVDAIKEFANFAFEKIQRFFTAFSMLLAKVPIRPHPIWRGVAVVVLAIVVYKLGTGFFSATVTT